VNTAQRLQLAREFSRELADRYNVAVDLAVHAPRAAGDTRNHHAHLLATSREVTAAGFGAKTGLDMASAERLRRGLLIGIAEIKAIRERWAVLSNQALAAAGLDVRIDHRSLRAQGIEREPVPQIPLASIQMERRGLRSEIAERIRARYRARVEARQAGAAARSAAPPSPVGLHEIRRQAREAWLQLRGQAVLQPEPMPRQSSIKESSRTGQLSPEHAPGQNSPADRPRAAATPERDAPDRDFAL
jgi:hypothetical protein